MGSSFKSWRPLLGPNTWNKTMKISDKFFNLNSRRNFAYNVKNQRQEVIKNISDNNINCGKKFNEGKNTIFVKMQNKDKIRFTVQYAIPKKLGLTDWLYSSSVISTSINKYLFENYNAVAATPRAFHTSSVSMKVKEESGEQKLHYDRNFITEKRAINEYLLSALDLRGLRVTIRRSAFDHAPPDRVYWRKDVEARAITRWGSLERVELEREIKEQNEEEANFPIYKQMVFKKLMDRELAREQRMSRANWPVRNLQFKRDKAGITGESGRVVMSAIAINTANFGAKLFAWIMTGSHSMFSEAIHSLADTLNQIILAYGIHYSNKNPNKNHPYGYSNMQYVSSLISGVGIFCLGAGLSAYHGIQGIYNPSTEVESIPLALAILSASFVSESITLYMAIKSIRKSADEQGTTFAEFVWSGWDPCVNVVLLEDIAAVTGVCVAGGCMWLSHYTGSHIYDAAGSLIIASILGSVASFMIYSNSQALVGRSIPDDRLEVLNKELEGDIMVRQVYDVKGMDMGNGIVRYKAEVDFDGRELARSYLQQRNLQNILKTMNEAKSEADAEEFLLHHGEQIVDCLGSEVDRIEKNLKTLHPEVRHVDLEVL